MAATRRAKARQTRLSFPSERSSSPPVEGHTRHGARASQNSALLPEGDLIEGRVPDDGSQVRTRNKRRKSQLRFESSNVKLVDKHRSLPTPVATSQPSEHLDDSGKSTSRPELETEHQKSERSPCTDKPGRSPDDLGSLKMAKRKAGFKPRHKATAMFKSQITPTKALPSPLGSSQQSMKSPPMRNPLFAPPGPDPATGKALAKDFHRRPLANSHIDSDSDVQVVGSRGPQSHGRGHGLDDGVDVGNIGQSSDHDDLPSRRRSRVTKGPGSTQLQKRPMRLLSRKELESRRQTSKADSSGDGSDVISPAPRKRPRTRSHVQLSSDESDGIAGDAELAQSENSIPSGQGRQQVDEVIEDAEDLKGTGDSPDRLTRLSLTPAELCASRTRGHATRHKKQTARARQLEMLRARRQGKDVTAALDESDPSSQAAEEDHSPRRGFTQQRYLEPDAIREGDDESFVVEDEDEGDDASWRNQIPLELSSHSHMDIKEYFRHVVEWMVHRKLNPAFDRHDPLYAMAFRKIDDEAKGYAGSKFTSASWKPEFKRTLEARPDFTDVEDTSPVLAQGCEACGRSSHPARWRITFSGGAYDPKTLEPLKEEDPDDSDAETQSYDVDGHALAREDYEFQVGRHCKSNAFIAHSLLHWRWHLNQWVLQWLETQGYTKPERLVEREGWSIKKQGQFANRTIDEMVENQEIKSLWRDFKTRLEEARSSKVAAFGRGGEVRK